MSKTRSKDCVESIRHSKRPSRGRNSSSPGNRLSRRHRRSTAASARLIPHWPRGFPCRRTARGPRVLSLRFPASRCRLCPGRRRRRPRRRPRPGPQPTKPALLSRRFRRRRQLGRPRRQPDPFKPRRNMRRRPSPGRRRRPARSARRRRRHRHRLGRYHRRQRLKVPRPQPRQQLRPQPRHRRRNPASSTR